MEPDHFDKASYQPGYRGSVLLFFGQMLEAPDFSVGKRKGIRLEIEIERVSLVQVALEMKSEMIGRRETANLAKNLQEVFERIEVARGYILDIGEAGASRTLSPTDMFNRRERTINDRSVDIPDGNFQAQILTWPLSKIKPL